MNERALTQEVSAEDRFQARDEKAAELFAALPDPAAREQLVELYYPMAEYISRRFAGRGEPLEDLLQVASIGLLKAIDRFDPERGVRFDSYAVPTIVGELKRHFRDTGWALRVPRRLQERSLQLRSIIATLGQELGRSPSISEIAEQSDLTDEQVLEALEAVHAHTVGSLDAQHGDQDPEIPLGFEDHDLELTERWRDVAPLLRRLGERERQLLYYRFIADLSQSEIADLLGISQMHVSRLLSRTLAKLRERLGSTDQY
ncbi:MAG: SigB/SigF/SigG family RNA polymerase sigma factor [Actinomycetota bacterium]